MYPRLFFRAIMLCYAMLCYVCFSFVFQISKSSIITVSISYLFPICIYIHILVVAAADCFFLFIIVDCFLFFASLVGFMSICTLILFERDNRFNCFLYCVFLCLSFRSSLSLFLYESVFHPSFFWIFFFF